MGWVFACDHGVVGRCPACGRLAEPRRTTGEPDAGPAERGSRVRATAGSVAWWRRRAGRTG